MHRTSKRIALATALGLGGIGLAGLTAEAALAEPASGPAPSSTSSSPSSGTGQTPTPPAAGTDADGLVSAHSSSSLTVTDLFGRSRTFALGSGTTVHSGKDAATVADGEHVHVRGSSSGGTLQAADVDVHLAAIDGRVLSSSGSTLTVVDRDGLHQRITTSSHTAFTKDGQAADASAAAEGSVVHARGVPSSDGSSLDASTVDVRTSDAPPRGPAGAGHRTAPPAGKDGEAGRAGKYGPAGKHGRAGAPAGTDAGPAQPPTPPSGGDEGQPGGGQDGS